MALLADSTVDLLRARSLMGNKDINEEVPLDPAVQQVLNNFRKQRRTI